MSVKLGQNFLVNPYYLKAIVDKANILEEDFVIEIGPGRGNLTEFILEEGAQVVAIELDSKLIDILNTKFKNYSNFTLINQDVLKISLNELLSLKKVTGKVKIIGNIPYYITTPILFKFFDFSKNYLFDRMIVLVQKEVAQRIISKPGTKNYGLLSVNLQVQSNIKIHFDISNKNFSPPPKVTSSLIELIPNTSLINQIQNIQIFKKLTKSIFNFRRKTLKNSLILGGFNLNILDKLEQKKLNIRGEELDILELIDLSNKINQII